MGVATFTTQNDFLDERKES
jgi:hypothetical protein